MSADRITHHLMVARGLADDEVREHIDRALSIVRKAHHRNILEKER